ncbi:hypothetical protein [Janibacter anophelis]|uniref:hypothetical protein n=1 Tax=Janibacter anophelis TaxID=319054 RepID=UPI0013B04F88|nr:hypothetical protein [Janibacter anophelis]
MGRLPLWGSFAAGTTLGGGATGVVVAVIAGLVSVVPEPVRWWGLLATALVVVVLDLVEPVLRLPQRTTLIPQEVFARGMATGIFRFGLEYGTGVRTLVPSAAPWVALLTIIAWNPHWVVTLVAGLVFGLSRSLAVLQFVLLGADGWQAFLAGHTRLLERLGTLVTALACLAAVASAVGWGPPYR